MPDAAYFRRWRSEHPEYRERQNKARAERRRTAGRGSRSAEYATRPSRAIPDIPPLHVGHKLFEQARAIVGPRRTSLITLYDPLYEDLLSEAILALLEGRDPVAAFKAYATVEYRWGRVTAAPVQEGG